MSSGIARPSWYVVRTHPRAEARAAVNLERQGFETYLPRYLKRWRHARRVELIPAPLFPRYLFIAIDVATQRWRSIQSTFGVAQLVSNGEKPVAVPDETVDQLKRREDERGFVRLARNPQFSRGNTVRVVEGLFSECLGLVEYMTDDERVAILLDLLGRKVRVVMEVDAVMQA